MAEIIAFPGLGYDCNSYLIVDEKVVLIDSGTGAKEDLKRKVQEAAKKVDMIINTHAHFDHVGGNLLFEAEVAAHGIDVKEMEEGTLYGTAGLFIRSKASYDVDVVLKDGDVIETGELSLRVIHTPGHTPGGICLLSSSGHLFSGDTLFSGGSFGRTDLPGGSSAELIRSLERLKRTAFESLMPGHLECVKNGKEHLEAALRLFGEMYERV
ncbi:MAG: MBL fold metallo-hydrolase [Candidatus Hydrothermarchaeales archaeon]